MAASSGGTVLAVGRAQIKADHPVELTQPSHQAGAALRLTGSGPAATHPMLLQRLAWQHDCAAPHASGM
jgi:hypothetical protein